MSLGCQCRTHPVEQSVQRLSMGLWPSFLTSLAKLHCKMSKHWCGRKEDKAQTLNQPVGVAFRRLHRRVGPVTHHSDPFTFPSDQSDFSITWQWFTICCHGYVTGAVWICWGVCICVSMSPLESFVEYPYLHTLVHAVTNNCWNAIPENEANFPKKWAAKWWIVSLTGRQAGLATDALPTPHGIFSGFSFSLLKWGAGLHQT